MFASNTSPLLYFSGWDTGFLLRVYKKVHNDNFVYDNINFVFEGKFIKKLLLSKTNA